MKNKFLGGKKKKKKINKTQSFLPLSGSSTNSPFLLATTKQTPSQLSLGERSNMSPREQRGSVGLYGGSGDGPTLAPAGIMNSPSAGPASVVLLHQTCESPVGLATGSEGRWVVEELWGRLCCSMGDSMKCTPSTFPVGCMSPFGIALPFLPFLASPWSQRLRQKCIQAFVWYLTA